MNEKLLVVTTLVVFFFLLGAKLIVGLLLVAQLMIGLLCVPCLPPPSVGVSFFVHAINQQEWAPCIPIYKQREWDKKINKKFKLRKKKHLASKQEKEEKRKDRSPNKIPQRCRMHNEEPFDEKL
jgi:hypothetical protein